MSEAQEYRGATNTLTYKEHFDFDRFGNLYRKAANNSTTGQANPVAYSAIEDNQIDKNTNRFTSVTNTTYNEAGMVVGDNKFRSMNFAYDANGRQVKATKANVADAWSVYDALGNRVATKVNDVWQFVIYDAFGKLVAEYGTQGEGVGGVSYVLQDWQGSVRASVNNNGFIQARFDFTAFGEEVSLGVGLRSLEQGYTGDATTKQGYGLTEKDSSGQNHTWFRKQEQRAGRWTSPDPYKGSMSIGNPQSFNRYSYVENEPTNLADPTGLFLASCVTTIVYDEDGRTIIFRQMDCEFDWSSSEDTSWLYDPPLGGGDNGGGSYPILGSSSNADISKPRTITDFVRKGQEKSKKKKQYDDCVDAAHEKVIASESVQALLRDFRDKGARDHGGAAVLAEVGQKANDTLNPESKGRGRGIFQILAQVPAFFADIDRGDAIVAAIESQMKPERERCRKEVYGI